MSAAGVVLLLWLVSLALRGPNPVDISGGNILRVPCEQAVQVKSAVMGAFDAPIDTGHRAELRKWGLTPADQARAEREFEKLFQNCKL